jgi:hypothetical protein
MNITPTVAVSIKTTLGGDTQPFAAAVIKLDIAKIGTQQLRYGIQHQ